MDFPLAPRVILLTVAGSRAYGLHRAGSDVDLKGVAIPPRRYLHGFARRFEQADSSSHLAPFAALLNGEERQAVAETKLEGSIYHLVKFFSLAADANPNILDALFCRDDEVRLLHPLGARLREHRQLFLSAKAKHTFSGYAAAQMKRIQLHRRWLIQPPQGAPSRGEYGLPERTLIPADQLMAAQAAVRTQLDRWELDLSMLDPMEAERLRERMEEVLVERSVAADTRFYDAARSIGLDDNLILVMDRERRYESARKEWEQYVRWGRERNPERAALEAKFGYDAKHAAHLVRLLAMGREILTTGQVHVWRGGRDAELLQAIRGGAWSFDQLMQHAQDADAELEQIYRSGSFAVPKQVDRDALDRLCVSLVEEGLHRLPEDVE
jgi:predicted nucleotidyltransferase